jgi:phosphonate transport system substrate-binding protein
MRAPRLHPLFRLLALMLLVIAAATARAESAFILGLPPVHSARVLTERFEPLRAYLEKQLGQPVRIESGADFRRFHNRLLSGDFDLTITPAHFARIAQLDAGFQPLAQFAPDHDALLMHAAERPLNSVADLRGKQLAVIDRLAITVTATLQYLATQGLEADRDYRIVEHRTHASAAYSVAGGLSAAAVTTSQGLKQMPDDVRDKLLLKKHIANIPAFVLIARSGMPPSRASRLKSALLAFPRRAEGVEFLARVGYTKLIPVDAAEMKRADVYLAEIRKALK